LDEQIARFGEFIEKRSPLVWTQGAQRGAGLASLDAVIEARRGAECPQDDFFGFEVRENPKLGCGLAKSSGREEIVPEGDQALLVFLGQAFFSPHSGVELFALFASGRRSLRGLSGPNPGLGPRCYPRFIPAPIGKKEATQEHSNRFFSRKSGFFEAPRTLASSRP
jgi:hypothetical protein